MYARKALMNIGFYGMMTVLGAGSVLGMSSVFQKALHRSPPLVQRAKGDGTYPIYTATNANEVKQYIEQALQEQEFEQRNSGLEKIAYGCTAAAIPLGGLVLLGAALPKRDEYQVQDKIEV